MLDTRKMRDCSSKDYMKDIRKSLASTKKRHEIHAAFIPAAQNIADKWTLKLYPEDGVRVSQVETGSYATTAKLFFSAEDNKETVLKFMRAIRLLVPKDLKAQAPKKDTSDATVTFDYHGDQVDAIITPMFRIRFYLATSGKCELRQVQETYMRTEYDCSIGYDAFPTA